MRDRDFYLLDVLRERLEYPDLRRRVRAHAEAYDATAILIEDAGSGTSLLQDLWAEREDLRLIGIRPEGDKIVRLEAQSPLIEAGHVLLPHVLLPHEAPWLGDFEAELMAFPGARYDDQIDSLSQFLTWANKPRVEWDLL